MVHQDCEFCGKRYMLSSTQIRVGSRYCSRSCKHEGRKGPKGDAEERFWSKVEKIGHCGCWIWSAGAFRDGYGAFSYNRKPVRAHRFSYTISVGPIPEGMDILHSCDKPRCVNPNHLRPGTPKENAEDKVKRGRQSRTRKLSDDDVFAVRKSNNTLVEIAEEFGVSVGLVALIRGRTGYRCETPSGLSVRKEKFMKPNR